MIDDILSRLKESIAQNKAYAALIHGAAQRENEYFMNLFRQAKLSAHCRNMELAEYNAGIGDLLQYNVNHWLDYVNWDHELETIRWCIETSGSEELSIHKTTDNFVDYIELYSHGKQVAHCDIPYKKEDK